MIFKFKKTSLIKVNLNARTKHYTFNRELCSNEGYIIVKNSILLAGAVDKTIVGIGSASSVFHRVYANYGEIEARKALERAMGKLIKKSFFKCKKKFLCFYKLI